MSVFRFKKFDVINEQSPMKVNTDGVLLGAAVSLPQSPDASILDVGTGTGTIALMLAQRMYQQYGEASLINITGLEIDQLASNEANINFRNSLWRKNLKAVCSSLQNYSPENKFDLIISNPPYYDNSLTAPEVRRNLSRHTVSPERENHAEAALSYRLLMTFASKYLNDNGSLAIILPAEAEKEALRFGRTCGLFPSKILRIRTVSSKPPRRIIIEAQKSAELEISQTITILHQGQYTPTYISLLKDFYLNF